VIRRPRRQVGAEGAKLRRSSTATSTGHADFHEIRLTSPPTQGRLHRHTQVCVHAHVGGLGAVWIFRGTTAKCLIAQRLTAKRPYDNNLASTLRWRTAVMATIALPWMQSTATPPVSVECPAISSRVRVTGRWACAPDAPEGTVSVMQAHVKRMLDVIEQSYAERITLHTFAAMLNRQSSYLGHLFRQEVGMTVHQRLTRVRLDHAAELICKGVKIEAVALIVGYRCKKNFYRQFETTPQANGRLATCRAVDEQPERGRDR
jgi:AraC-like DNA-binding protein